MLTICPRKEIKILHLGSSQCALNTKKNWARREKCQKMSKVHELVPRFDIIIVFELLSTPTGAWLNAHFKLQKGSHIWGDFHSSYFFWSSSSLTRWEMYSRHKSASRGSAEAFYDFFVFRKIRTAACQSLSHGMTWHRCPYNVNYLSFWLADVQLRVNVRSYHNLIE
jgi:hypothetical protein